jgi:hypothetical protein
MIVTILNFDNRVAINTEVLDIDVPLDESIVAVHWVKDKGWIEYKDGGLVTAENFFTDLSPYQFIIDAFMDKKAELQESGTWESTVRINDVHETVSENTLNSLEERLVEIE